MVKRNNDNSGMANNKSLMLDENGVMKFGYNKVLIMDYYK